MTGRKIYRTMQGKIVDLDKLISKNELAPAVGNARVNARGDELGPGGKIVRKREDIMAEYYESNPNSLRDEIPNVPKAAKEADVKDIKTETAKKIITKKEVKDDFEDNQTDS